MSLVRFWVVGISCQRHRTLNIHIIGEDGRSADFTWKELKVHMGHAQEAYDAECAAIALALETQPTDGTNSTTSPYLRTLRRPYGG